MMTDTNTGMQTQQKEPVCECLSHKHACTHARTLTQLLFIYLNRCSGLSQVRSLNACHYCWRICAHSCQACVCLCSRKRGKEEWSECKVRTKGKISRELESGRKKERWRKREGNSLRRWGCRQKDGRWSPFFLLALIVLVCHQYQHP